MEPDRGPLVGGAPWWSQSCPSSRARRGEGGRGWAESVCPLSMNLCVKEKNQAVKGDAPGKFKLPSDSGEERGLRSPLPHSLPHALLSPEARVVPSTPPSTRLEASGDPPSHHTRPLLGHPGPQGLPVGTWSPRALGLSSLPSLHGSRPASGLGCPHLLSATSDETDRVSSVLASGAPCPPSSGSSPGESRRPAVAPCVCSTYLRVYFPGCGYGPWEAPPTHSLGLLCLVCPKEAKRSSWWPRTTRPTPS